MLAATDDNLGPKQERAIIALLNEANVAKAAMAADVSERRLYRWLAESAFSNAYRKARQEAFGQAIALTQRYAPLAVNTSAKVMVDAAMPASARVSAAHCSAALCHQSAAAGSGRVRGKRLGVLSHTETWRG